MRILSCIDLWIMCLLVVEYAECVFAVDETPSNCQMFIDGDGLSVFLACFNVCYALHYIEVI